MKKKVLCVITLIMLVMGYASAGVSSQANANGVDLDTAIREAALQMVVNLPRHIPGYRLAGRG